MHRPQTRHLAALQLDPYRVAFFPGKTMSDVTASKRKAERKREEEREEIPKVFFNKPCRGDNDDGVTIHGDGMKLARIFMKVFMTFSWRVLNHPRSGRRESRFPNTGDVFIA